MISLTLSMTVFVLIMMLSFILGIASLIAYMYLNKVYREKKEREAIEKMTVEDYFANELASDLKISNEDARKCVRRVLAYGKNTSKLRGVMVYKTSEIDPAEMDELQDHFFDETNRLMRAGKLMPMD